MGVLGESISVEGTPHIKIVSVKYRSAQETVVLVLLWDSNMDWYTARMAPSKYGIEPHDTQYAAQYGAKLLEEEAVAFFPEMKGKKYKPY